MMTKEEGQVRDAFELIAYELRNSRPEVRAALRLLRKYIYGPRKEDRG